MGGQSPNVSKCTNFKIILSITIFSQIHTYFIENGEKHTIVLLLQLECFLCLACESVTALAQDRMLSLVPIMSGNSSITIRSDEFNRTLTHTKNDIHKTRELIYPVSWLMSFARTFSLWSVEIRKVVRPGLCYQLQVKTWFVYRSFSYSVHGVLEGLVLLTQVKVAKSICTNHIWLLGLYLSRGCSFCKGRKDH